MKREIEQDVGENGEFYGYFCPVCNSTYATKIEARECCDRAIDE